MTPKMIVVAGPPGSGKSTSIRFPFLASLTSTQTTAPRNSMAAHISVISRDIRQLVNLEFEQFVLRSIEKRVSFAIETTLRSEVTFDQARLAKQAGFVVEVRYLALRVPGQDSSPLLDMARRREISKPADPRLARTPISRTRQCSPGALAPMTNTS